MSPAEAQLAIAAGASALGLVGAMPSGPGVIGDELIAAIARTVPPPVATFLLTAEQSVAGIVAHHRRVHTSVIQIVDRLAEGAYAELRAQLPGIKLVQVIHVRDAASVAEAVSVAGQVDSLLLDSGRPDQAVKELGGTGRTHDWALSREVRAAVPIPVFLAGGLRPDNVREAIAQVGPFGLDVCSGVRSRGCRSSDGKLDPRKLAAFFETVWEDARSA